MSFKYFSDLHIHSCLSPCADNSMTPLNIVRTAKARGLNLLALTDHNSAANCPVFWKLCLDNEITPLAGMEIASKEGVHVLALFDDPDAAMDLSGYIKSTLPSDKRHTGKNLNQFLSDEKGQITGREEICLGNFTDKSFEELFHIVNSRNGLFIPAHIRRPYFSVYSQLGGLPDLPYDMVEMYKPVKEKKLPVITNSDAHCPEQIAFRKTVYEISDKNRSLPLLEQIKKAAGAAMFRIFIQVQFPLTTDTILFSTF